MNRLFVGSNMNKIMVYVFSTADDPLPTFFQSNIVEIENYVLLHCNRVSEFINTYPPEVDFTEWGEITIGPRFKVIFRDDGNISLEQSDESFIISHPLWGVMVADSVPDYSIRIPSANVNIRETSNE